MGQTRVKKSKKSLTVLSDASGVVTKRHETTNSKNDAELPSHSESRNPHICSSTSDKSSDDEHNLTADPTYIEVRSTEGKGVAVFAARKIPAGTLILAETPLIRLTQSEEDDDKISTTSDSQHKSSLIHQFSHLPKPLQKAYLSLFDSEKSGFSQVKSIYYSNCYNLSGINKPHKTSPGGSCIGTVASRINHSCLPNTQFSFDEHHNLMLFHAMKPIPKGRELVSNYDSVYELRAQRQTRQTLYYGFRCDCEACEPGTSEFWNRSDERRRGMIDARKDSRSYEKTFECTGKVDAGIDPIGALVKVEAHMVKEGLAGTPLADVYRSLTKWAERMGDGTEAKRWRLKELDACVVCLGRGSVRVKELKLKLSPMEEVGCTT